MPTLRQLMVGLGVPLASQDMVTSSSMRRWLMGAGRTVVVGGSRTITSIKPDEPAVRCAL